MKRVLVCLVVLTTCAGMSDEAFAQGYVERHYQSFWYQPPYQNNYHGYWRDLGYGFSNRQPYGIYYHSQSHREVIPYSWPAYAVPAGSQRRR